MTDPTVVIIGSFLLAFKAILIEGSEVAILSLATIKQLGRNNILFGVIAGGLGSIVTFLVVWRIFLLLPAIVIDFATAIVLFYFSSRFLRGFIKYAIRHKSFREKMARMEKEVIEKHLKREGAVDATQPIRFSIPNSLPVLTITLTEGFEASLVLAAAGAFNILSQYKSERAITPLSELESLVSTVLQATCAHAGLSCAKARPRERRMNLIKSEDS